jgi:streptomycin 6-kinase
VIALPPVVLARARRLGDPGRRWLAELPALVAELERRWSITVGPPLAGGSASFVARAGDGAVLKIALPEPFGEQVRTMVAADGRGYARVLAHDLEHRALLMEALGPPMALLGLPPEWMIERLCRTLRDAWRVQAWPGLGPTPRAEQLAALIEELQTELGRPSPEPVLTQALRYAERRAAVADPARCVVVHGDPHPGNALRAAGAASGFAFVDPDGLFVEPAYDLGVVLRDWCAELEGDDAPTLARRYCRLLSGHTGVDEAAIWEWGFIERVSTGLFVRRLGVEERFLATAERLLTA